MNDDTGGGGRVVGYLQYVAAIPMFVIGFVVFEALQRLLIMWHGGAQEGSGWYYEYILPSVMGAAGGTAGTFGSGAAVSHFLTRVNVRPIAIAFALAVTALWIAVATHVLPSGRVLEGFCEAAGCLAVAFGVSRRDWESFRS